MYYHEACLTASTKDKESPVSARKSTPASAAKHPTASEAPPPFGAGPKTLMNFATIEKGRESKMSVGAVDEAPRSQRGVCPACEEVMLYTHKHNTLSHRFQHTPLADREVSVMTHT